MPDPDLASLRRRIRNILILAGLVVALLVIGWQIDPAALPLPAFLWTPTATPSITPTPTASLTPTYTPLPPTSTPLPPTATPTETLTPTSTPLLPEMTDEQQVPMVLVPAGSFLMGSEATLDEQPVHEVYLDTFYIDKYEVTNALYKVCVDAGACPWPTNRDYIRYRRIQNYPVNFVTWEMAKTYCEWRGARLPTEAEWEKAAQGQPGWMYPWGNTIDCNRANYGDCRKGLIAVGKYKLNVSIYGAYDMPGNAWEWVADWYASDYYSTLPNGAVNPQGPERGEFKVIRGGSTYTSSFALRIASRDYLKPNLSNYDGSFRCARSVEP
ncbi:MAG: formylglycine-generating enzyme family protein [Anaerolineales bacterium]